ncbi:MAG: DUF934 domain-containing protein [Pseudomonadota bacterium]
MPTLFVDGLAVEDTWTLVDGEQPIPDGEDVIVTLPVYQANRDKLLARNDGRVGVHLDPLEPVEAIADDLDHLALVSLDFPSFADGTSFSKARLLRDRHGFEGEVRATGDIRIDQVSHMQRCGFDALSISHQATINSLIEVKDPSLKLYYQPALGDSDTRISGKAWARRAG